MDERPHRSAQVRLAEVRFQAGVKNEVGLIRSTETRFDVVAHGIEQIGRVLLTPAQAIETAFEVYAGIPERRTTLPILSTRDLPSGSGSRSPGRRAQHHARDCVAVRASWHRGR